MRIEDFVFPYVQLGKNSEWVKLADLVPWNEAEEACAKQFVNNGHPAHPARIALGALIIKQRLKYSDEWTVEHVSENPYLQFFLSLKEYTSKCPFGASTMVEFRKRFPPETIAALLAASTPKEDLDDHDAQNGGGSGENKGTLIMDATCCPADISCGKVFGSSCNISGGILWLYQRMRKGYNRQRNRNIRISATETLSRANLELTGAAMGSTASWRTCRELPSVSSTLLCCA